ncbi:MAG: hypothetical protein DRR00_32935 [Candidatus Parabeggiatoa sp. nov. 3]|nr:MAG: hypothetical protein DRR00_32935 [Gammaproteobacteria bacterium]
MDILRLARRGSRWGFEKISSQIGEFESFLKQNSCTLPSKVEKHSFTTFGNEKKVRGGLI